MAGQKVFSTWCFPALYHNVPLILLCHKRRCLLWYLNLNHYRYLSYLVNVGGAPPIWMKIGYHHINTDVHGVVQTVMNYLALLLRPVNYLVLVTVTNRELSPNTNTKVISFGNHKSRVMWTQFRNSKDINFGFMCVLV